MILHFGAVDYQAWVWLNGRRQPERIAGACTFLSMRSSAFRKENELVVKVFDPLDLDQPRGRAILGRSDRMLVHPDHRYLADGLAGAIPEDHLQSCRILPDLDDGSVDFVRPAAPCPPSFR